MAKPIMRSIIGSSDRPRALKWTEAVSFTLGHILNDLCGSMWYSYILVFLVLVQDLPAITAGVIMTAGFASDAFFTPIVAYQTDHGFRTRCSNAYGHRKTVHLLGSLAVILTFPLLFSDTFSNLDFTPRVGIIILLACIFQCGFAAIQISHISMIPQLTPNNWERDELNIFRFCGDVLSDVTVFLITYTILVETSNTAELADQLDPGDEYKLRDVALIITSIGVLCTFIYQIGTPEKIKSENGLSEAQNTSKPGSAETSDTESTHLLQFTNPRLGRRARDSLVNLTDISNTSFEDGNESNVKSWKDWLTSGPQFYQVGLLLIIGRLYNNVNTSLLPLYLSEGIEPASLTYLAIVPLLLNLSSFVFSILIKFLSFGVSKKVSSVIGSGLAFTGCIWLSVGYSESIKSWAIFPVTILLGGGGSMLQVIALNYTSDLIGSSTDSASFVYGTMGFIEKIANGLFILLVQLYKGYCLDCNDFYRRVLVHSSGSLAILSLLVVLTVRRNVGAVKHNEIIQVNGTSSTSPTLP